VLPKKTPKFILPNSLRLQVQNQGVNNAVSVKALGMLFFASFSLVVALDHLVIHWLVDTSP
jgi:hypothetical protein